VFYFLFFDISPPLLQLTASVFDPHFFFSSCELRAHPLLPDGFMPLFLLRIPEFPTSGGSDVGIYLLLLPPSQKLCKLLLLFDTFVYLVSFLCPSLETFGFPLLFHYIHVRELFFFFVPPIPFSLVSPLGTRLCFKNLLQ